MTGILRTICRSSRTAACGRHTPIRGTPGAQFPSALHVPRGAAIIDKATRRDAEAYSGFQGTDLAELLRRSGVEELYIVGLATDYCVKNTVTDGIAAGFRLKVVSDCVKGVNLKRTDSATAFRSMEGKGAGRTTSQLLLRHLSGTCGGLVFILTCVSPDRPSKHATRPSAVSLRALLYLSGREREPPSSLGDGLPF